MTRNRLTARLGGRLCLALLTVCGGASVRAQVTGNTNATCCPTAQAARNLGQVRWHLLRTSLGSGVGDLVFVAPAKLTGLHRSYRRYLAQIPGCRDVGMAPRPRPAGRPYPFMWLMISAARGSARTVRVWNAATALAPLANGGANIYLVPQVLHVRQNPPRHCLVLASPGRWRLVRVRKK